MGRRKIEIQPITHERNRSVTFLKRKNGLFKKAYELGVLCSVDVAVIIFEERPGHHVKLYEYSSARDIRDIVSRHVRYDGEKDARGPKDFSSSTAKNQASDEDDDDDDDSRSIAIKRGRGSPQSTMSHHSPPQLSLPGLPLPSSSHRVHHSSDSSTQSSRHHPSKKPRLIDHSPAPTPSLHHPSSHSHHGQQQPHPYQRTITGPPPTFYQAGGPGASSYHQDPGYFPPPPPSPYAFSGGGRPGYSHPPSQHRSSNPSSSADIFGFLDDPGRGGGFEWPVHDQSRSATSHGHGHGHGQGQGHGNGQGQGHGANMLPANPSAWLDFLSNSGGSSRTSWERNAESGDSDILAKVEE